MDTQVIKIEAGGDVSSAVWQAAAVLDNGGLVAFGTETVYGLAARADIATTMERLATLKERPADKPFTLHIGDKLSLERYVGRLSLLDREFLRKAWPGPLTVIFQVDAEQPGKIGGVARERATESLYHNNSIGIRLPDHAATRQLLTAAAGPIVAPSANLAGSMPAMCARDVMAELDGKIELVLDSGPTRYRKASTIVKLANGDMELVREGVLDAGTVRRMRSITILFVCTGNSCRSAMAEGFCRYALAEKLGCSVDQLAEKGYKVESAGVMAFGGGRASPESIEVCDEAGVDISGHRSRRLTEELINDASVIYVMDARHRRATVGMVPGAAGRVFLLADDKEITDPIGMSVKQYRRYGGQIAQCVHNRLEELF